MAQYSIKIENLAEIQAAFKKSPEIMSRKLQEAIVKSIAEVDRESTLNLSGRMVNVQTGYLRSSVMPAFAPLQGSIEYLADYAPYVHEGTRYMTARPFLAEAVQSKGEAVNGLFRKAVQDTLDEIARSTK